MKTGLTYLLITTTVAANLLIACKPAGVTKIEPGNVQLNDKSTVDSAIIRLIEPYKASLESEMNEVLIRSESEAVKGQPEGKLGNLIADISLNRANKYLAENLQQPGDICMLNNGGLRTSLPAGDITRGKVFELMPFENKITVLTLSGTQTLEMFRYIARSNGVPLAGAKMEIQGEDPVNIQIGDLPLDTARNYRIITSDYLAGGGDKMKFFVNPIHKQILDRKLRDSIIEFMVEERIKGQTLKPVLDRRITKL